MSYDGFGVKAKRHVNGVIASYMDHYIRNNLIWTPEQMYEDFLIYMQEKHRKGFYGPRENINKDAKFLYKNENLWLATENARTHITKAFEKKYNKNKTLARKNNPLEERIRLGVNRSKYKNFDLNYGLKGGYSYEKASVVEKCDLIPWTIEHVNSQLSNSYKTDLRDIFPRLLTTPEQDFFANYWVKHYYNDDFAPALLPKIYGMRKQFYCYKSEMGYSLSRPDDTDEFESTIIPFDFAVINFHKQSKLLITIAGKDHPKLASIKNDLALAHNWPHYIVNADLINDDISNVFRNLNKIFQK